MRSRCSWATSSCRTTLMHPFERFSNRIYAVHACVLQVALNWNLQKGFLVLVGIRSVDQVILTFLSYSLSLISPLDISISIIATPHATQSHTPHTFIRPFLLAWKRPFTYRPLLVDITAASASLHPCHAAVEFVHYIVPYIISFRILRCIVSCASFQ